MTSEGWWFLSTCFCESRVDLNISVAFRVQSAIDSVVLL